jgi:hypothetical protein
MFTITSLAATGAPVPPPISPALFGQMDAAALLGPSYATMREAFGLHQPFHGYAGDSIAAATKLLGGSLPSPAFFGQIDSTVKQLANQQNAIATAVGTAIGALVERETFGISGMSDAILASGVGPATAAMKAVADSQAALTSMQSGFGHWADSLTRLTQDIARLGTAGSAPIPYPIPAIHIRRAPAPLPSGQEASLIVPERRRRRLGRPRGSYQCAPELVIATYHRLAASSRHVTQEQLASELGVELRTIQRWLTQEHMGLGWPPKP